MSIARHHAEWLSLVEQSGPFLSMPVLLRVLPQGLDAHDPAQVRSLRRAHEIWEDGQDGQDDARQHRAWVRFVLTQTLELPDEVLKEGQGIPQSYQTVVPQQGENLRPDLAVMDGERPLLLIQIYAPGQDLDKPLPTAHWKASPATRMMELLHGAGCRLGLATNGERWMLVDAPREGTT